MPYVLACHHPMVHFALFVAGLIVEDGFSVKNIHRKSFLEQNTTDADVK